MVFATQWRTEGFDLPDLSLPNGQDALIAAIAAANPRTIVVLETGGPVLMPWLDKTAAVIEAWYPGARGGEAIASGLFGETNPSGRLLITFPANEAQLPRPEIDGFAKWEPNFFGSQPSPNATLLIDYDLEGSDVGYRWFARQDLTPLFPFGFGLSYTSFAETGLKLSGTSANCTVQNAGSRSGDDVVQLYLVSRVGQRKRRLVGFKRVSLDPGQVRTVRLDIDPRLLADWVNGHWVMPAGEYGFALAKNAMDLGSIVKVDMAARTWQDTAN